MKFAICRPVSGAQCRFFTFRAAPLLVALFLIGMALPAGAGMPSRAGAGHSLVNPPGSKAAPLPRDMAQVRLITADSLLSQCVMGALPAKSAPDMTTLTCDQVVGGADHVVAGVGGRVKSSAHLAVAGVPAGSVAVEAFLYWAVLREEHSSVGETLSFAGSLVEGAVIGEAVQPCWDAGTKLVAFRAPITHLLRGGINGDYAVGGLPLAAGVTAGISPWDREADVAPYFEGLAVVVVYLNETVPWDSVVAIHDGPFNLFEELTVRHQLSEPFPPRQGGAGMIRHSRIAADGQTSRDLEATVGLNTWLGPQAEVLIRGSKSQYDQSSDFSGASGGTVTQLFDAESTELALDEGLLPLSGKRNYEVRYELDLDFLTPPCTAPVFPEGGAPEAGGDPEEVEVLVDCITVLAHVITFR